MAKLQSVCVYCGSSAGHKPEYSHAADRLGALMASHPVRLVYGGGSVGLMGVVARAVLREGGKVTGVIPRFLADREIMLKEAHDLITTDDMHQRKRMMFDRSDAFVALPGGIGTLEEVIEMLTWAQLGRHTKPVLLANLDGFWDPLLALLDHMADQDFVSRQFIDRILRVDDVEAILPALEHAARPLSETELGQTVDQVPLSNL